MAIAGITKRTVKGSPLTSLEGDNNLEALSNAIDDLASVPSNFPKADGSTIQISGNTISVKDGGLTSAKYAAGSVNNAAVASDAIKPTNVASAATSVTSVSNSTAVDASLGWAFYTTLTENTSFVISNMKEGQPISIAVTQNGGSAKTVAWTTTVKWTGASAPVMTTTLGRTDVFTLVKINGVIYGGALQNCG